MAIKLKYHPFYSIHCEALKEMFGVDDIRTIERRIKEIGAPVYSKGKNRYIITDELIEAIKNKDSVEIRYIAKGTITI